jgi:hypothetical protein
MKIIPYESEIDRMLASITDWESFLSISTQLDKLSRNRFTQDGDKLYLGKYELGAHDSAISSISIAYAIAKRYREVILPTLEGELLEIHSLIINCSDMDMVYRTTYDIMYLLIEFARKGGTQLEASILVNQTSYLYTLDPDITDEIIDASPLYDLTNLISEFFAGISGIVRSAQRQKKINFSFTKWEFF